MGVLVLSGLGAVAIPNEEIISKNISINFTQPTIKSETEFVTISIDQANGYIMEQGKPILPSYIQKFVFPFGTKINSVKCNPTNIQTQTVTKELKPTPQAVLVSQKVVSPIVNQIIDYGSEPYPSNWFEYDVGSGLEKGELSIIVTVQINPVKYHPTEKLIEWIKDADISITYEPSDYQSTNQEDYQFVVIAPDEYSDELTELISHKNSRGITTKFVGLNEIYTGQGRDSEERIKFFIRDAIENWGTSNILLVGSESKLPSRDVYVWIQEEYEQSGYSEIFVSDLYYADIYNEYSEFIDWDSNGNNQFGEYQWDNETDEVDLLPDVYLGRWPCTTGAQVQANVNKVIYYEQSQAYKEDWFSDFVVIGGDTSPDYKTVEGEFINERAIDIMDGFSPEKLWVTNGVLTSWIPTGVASIQKAINYGCGFVYFSGHGNTNVWATHPEEKHSWTPTPTQGIFNFQIEDLSNGNKLPIVVVEACSTAKFNVDSNSFNWAFLHNPNGGGIGAFGATALGWGYVGTGIASGLIGKMALDTFRSYMLDESTTLGEMWYNAQDRYIKSNMKPMDHKVSREWILFGDPTLKIGEKSLPPETPETPVGPTSGKPNEQLMYISSTTDPEEDDIYYMFDWGDGTDSGWIGPIKSGDQVTANKIWKADGTYGIKVVARDERGKRSGWSDELKVTIPRSKPRALTTEGTFTAEIGRRGSSDTEIILNGNYKERTRFKVIWGTATTGEKQGRFRGIFYLNHFIIKVPTPRNTINIFGRCTFDGNDFSGQWISRRPYSRGWIEGAFTPS